MMDGIYVTGIQDALPIEPLFANAQIGDAISNSLRMVIAGRAPSYHSSNTTVTDKITLVQKNR